MEGSEMGGKSETESPPLQIDPKCFQDALRAFFQPIKTEDPRLDFYTMYKREATEYDTDYVKKYDEDLNTTLIFAGLFSAVSSAFVIDVHANLQPNPNEQSAALLRAILLALNQSAIPSETPTVPLVREDPSGEIVTVTCLMYASLLISLLAAFVAMLGKQWLNRYLRNSGGSMIERCGDRQRKCDGLEKWPLHFFIESLPVMLQVALLLLTCGLCRHMWSVSASVAYVLVSLTGLGVGFYVIILIAGMTSYACPFQTPVSIALYGQWKKVRRGILSCILQFKWVFSWTRQMWNQSLHPLLRCQSLPAIPLEAVRVQQLEPWPKPKDLDIARRTNTNDVRCVSWILRNITDPEALDAAIRLAGEIRWFDDGINVEPPHDLIVATFEACFDPTGKLYPGSRDRAYYSGRAMAWIHTLAMCKSEESASRFLPPHTKFTCPGSDHDLKQLLRLNCFAQNPTLGYVDLLWIGPEHTPSHLQWISNTLLHHSWANWTARDNEFILDLISKTYGTAIPLNAILNRLLVWCIFLGSPVEEEVLKVQGKSYFLERILYRLSKVVLSAINDAGTRRRFIPHVLNDLIKLETRPVCLTEIAYEWCSAICENYQNLRDWESLLLPSLEIGFRHLDFQDYRIEARITHTEHHKRLVGVVFESRKSEAIADLLHVWTAEGGRDDRADILLSLCTEHLVGLHDLVPSSSRLRRLVIRSVELVGYEGFEEVGMVRSTELLNHLCVTVEDMDECDDWAELLFNIIQSSGGAQLLSDWYWDLLVGLATSSESLGDEIAYNPQVIAFLTEAQEWSKLECWMGIVGMVWPPEAGGIGEKDLYRSMLLLVRQRPGAVQRLEQLMELRHCICDEDIPESLQRICEQVLKATQRDTLPISFINNVGGEEPASSPPPKGNKFWESLQYHVF